MIGTILSLLSVAGLVGYFYSLYTRLIGSQQARAESQAQVKEEFKVYNEQISQSLAAVGSKKEQLNELEKQLPDPSTFNSNGSDPTKS